MSFIETLKKSLDAMKIPCDESQLQKMKAHYLLMLRENEKVNLTRITDEEEAAVKHYADSAAILSVVNLRLGAHIIDIGSGAGFPGIPLKILRPDIYLCLLDSTKKKADFLERCISGLGLQHCRVINARAEDAARDPLLRERFDAAAARAVAKMSVLCELALPFLKVGGLMLAYKGPGAREKTEEAKNAIKILGGKEEGVYEIELEGYSHIIFVVKKVSMTLAKYPRRAGFPGKNPL
ncbi:MAG: 16S rRNA (guanine(527)-N(7))-methyltransferase RsmG [Bacillota bacterium]|nr:16S rRNA (guanine(527)-N(7))-methyltransferase RsmG [Bacillota bacterium]